MDWRVNPRRQGNGGSAGNDDPTSQVKTAVF
jgi:hypothetical protein